MSDETEETYRPKPGHRRRRFEALSANLGRLTARAMGRRGFAQGAVVRDWPVIVGDVLARQSAPERILYPRGAKTGGTLHLRVANPGLALELQHLEPMVLDRVNGYFGFRAVEKVKILQAPLPSDDEPATPRRALTAAEVAALKRDLTGVEDAELRASLERLGTAIRRRKPR